jgi:hypothetical protein
MATLEHGRRLLGRRDESAVLDEVVASVRAGLSRALVLRGEPGVGKSALLEYLTQHAPGCAIARAAGVESEVAFAYAGLQQLCSPFMDRLERLPGPQRDALGTALGLRDGGAPDGFLVGLAVLSLLSDAAEDRPLICVVDDAQWLDAASMPTLAFVARRLGAESVGLVFAVREPIGARDLDGLQELVIGGLDDEDARALLEAVLTGPLDKRVRDRIVAETGGNPLALLELPHGRSPAELAGGFGLDGGPALSGRIEERFQERLEELPPATRLLLLVAAAEPIGDPLLLWNAAAALGIDASAAAPESDEGLVELGAQVRFRHPLVRSALYGAASPEERRRVHAALADATDADVDPDRRAWHRAHATAGLDEAVAAELERSADRARARGSLAAGAAFVARAAELTPDPKQRAQRALTAAQGKHQAGAPTEALRLLEVAESGPIDELDQARAQLLRAQITFAATRGRDAPPLLLAAAKRLEPLDATLARETYLEAFAAALSADRLAQGGDAGEVATAVLAADWEPSTRACDLLLDSLALLTCRGYTAGAPALKHALAVFREEALSEEEELRWLWLACHIARALCDDAAWDELTARQVELARRAGALSLLPVALDDRLIVDLFAGKLAVAESLAAEAEAVIDAPGSHLTLRAPLSLGNWGGQEEETLSEPRRQEALRRGEGLWLRASDWSLAVRYNGLGRYDEALAAAERAAEDPHGLGVTPWVLADLIEAATRAGQPERAAAPLERLAQIAEASGTDWVLGGPRPQPRAVQRRGGGGAALPRGDRAVRAHARARIAGPWAPRVRRVAAPREPPRRRPRAAPGSAQHAHRHGHGGVRGPRPARAARHRGDGAQAHGRDGR